MFVRSGARIFRFNNVVRRMYGTGLKREEPPSFKTIALVGLIGTAIFVKAVERLDQNKPRNSFSENEFDNVMSGLRRRVSMFKPEELNITCVQDMNAMRSVQIPDGSKVFKPIDAVEYYRSQCENKFSTLLNEKFEEYGDSYVEKLPAGLAVVLIGKYMKERCEIGDDVYLMDFPRNVADAIKFENEVSVINKVISGESNSDNEVINYYKTVNKVESV